MSQIFQQTLNLDVIHQSEVVPIPNTGYSTNAVNAVADGSNATSGIILFILIILLVIIGGILFYLRRKSNKKSHLFRISGIFCFAFACGLFVPAITSLKNAQAETVVTDITTTFDITATKDGNSSISSINLPLTQDYESGYKVLAYMAGDNTLYGASNPESKIIATTAALTTADVPINSYGIQTQDGSFMPISTDATSPTEIFSTDNSAQAGDVAIITYIAKLDQSTPEDIYTGKITLEIQSNKPEPLYLQDVADWRDSLTVDQQVQAIDSRDGKVYWVAKLQDDNIWMTQNLDYDLANTTLQSLTPSTSDVSANITITPTTWGEDTDSIYFHEGGDYYLPNGKDSQISTSGLAADAVEHHYELGNYYSWKAATAGSGTATLATSEAPDSLCPKGWRLPVADATTGDYSFGDMAIAYGAVIPFLGYGINDAPLLITPLFFIRGGRIINGALSDLGSIDYVWSSVAGNASSNAWSFRHQSGYVNLRGLETRDYGLSIRCIAR